MTSSVLRAPKNDFAKLLAKKAGFISHVYMLLALQIAITSAVAIYLRRHQQVQDVVSRYFILWFIMSIALILLLAFTSTMHPVLKFTILCAFSFVMGLNCIAASGKVSPEVIKVALVSTLGIFVAMSVVGVVLVSMGVHLGFMAYVLLCALIALLIAFLVMMFVPVSKAIYKTVLVIGITLFSVFIAYDTNVMLQRDYRGDAIDASINLYLDALNIFTEIVALDSN